MVTATDVIEYCKTHSTIEAAHHFKVSDSYIRRLKRQHKEQDPAIAGDDTQWPCPVTGELHPIIPGTIRSEWEHERKALHQRLSVMASEAELEAEAEEVPNDIIEGGTEAEQTEPELETKDEEPRVLSELPGIPMRVERVVIVKRLDTSPMAALIAPFVTEHYHLLIGLVAATFLIMVSF